MANTLFKNRIFLPKKNISEAKFKELQQKYPDLELVREDVSISYSLINKKFGIYTEGETRYPQILGNLALLKNKDKISIVNQKPTNEFPISLVGIKENQMFFIDDLNFKEQIKNLLTDFKENNIKINDSMVFLANRAGGLSENTIIFSEALNSITLKDEYSKDYAKVLDLDPKGDLRGGFLGNSSSKALINALNLQDELLLKINLMNRFFNIDRKTILLEANDYIKNNESKINTSNQNIKDFLYFINSIDDLEKEQTNVLFGNAFESDIFLKILGQKNENNAERKKTLNELLLGFLEEHPSASATWLNYKEIFDNYDKNTILDLMTSKSPLGLAIEDFLENKNNLNEIIIPQGLENIDKLNTSDLKALQNYYIMYRGKEDKKENMHSKVRFSSVNFQENDSFAISALNSLSNNTAGKLFIDITSEKLQKKEKDFLIGSRGESFVLTNDNKILQGSPKIDLGDGIFLTIKGDFFSRPNEEPYSNINSLISKRYDDLSSWLQISNRSVISEFDNLKSYLENTQSLIISLKEKSALKSFVSATFESELKNKFPTGAFTSKTNKNIVVRTPDGEKKDEGQQLNNIAIDRAFGEEAGFDLTEPKEKRVPKKNIAFAGNGVIQQNAFPISLLLKTQEQKDLFFSLLDSASKKFIKDNSDLDEQQKNDIFSQITALKNDKTLSSASLTVVSAINNSDIKSIVPIEYFAGLNQDGSFIGHFPIPSNFIFNEMIEKDIIDLNTELATPQISLDNKLSILKKSNEHFSAFVNTLRNNSNLNNFDATLVKAFLHLGELRVNNGNKNIIDTFQDILNKEEYVKDFSKKMTGNEDTYLDSILNLLELSKKHIQSVYLYPSADNILSMVKSNMFLTNTILNILNGKDSTEKLEEAMENGALSENLYKKIHQSIADYFEGVETIPNASKIIAISLLCDTENKIIIDNFNNIEQAVSKLKKDETLQINDTIKNKRLLSTINAIKNENEGLTQLEIMLKAKKEINVSLEKAFLNNFVKRYKQVNGLRDYQINTLFAKVLLDKDDSLGIHFDPRMGKTITTLFTLLFSSDKATFFVQTKNAEDIIKQAMKFLPEKIFLFNLKGNNKINLLPDSFKNNQKDSDVFLNLPLVLKNFLNMEKSVDKKHPKSKLDEDFLSDYIGIKDFIEKSGKENINNILKGKTNAKTFYSIYEDMETKSKEIAKISPNKNIYNWKISAFTAFYVTQLLEQDYIFEKDKKEITKTILNKYEEALKEKGVENKNKTQIDLDSKSGIEKQVPYSNGNFEKNIAYKTEIELSKTPFKIDLGGIRQGGDYKFNDEDSTQNGENIQAQIIPLKQSMPDMLNFVKEEVAFLKNIDFAKDSSLKTLGEKNRVALLPIYDDKKRLTNAFDMNYIFEVAVRNTIGKEVYDVMRKTINETIKKAFEKINPLAKIEDINQVTNSLAGSYYAEIQNISKLIMDKANFNQKTIDDKTIFINDLRISNYNLFKCYAIEGQDIKDATKDILEGLMKKNELFIDLSDTFKSLTKEDLELKMTDNLSKNLKNIESFLNKKTLHRIYSEIFSTNIQKDRLYKTNLKDFVKKYKIESYDFHLSYTLNGGIIKMPIRENYKEGFMKNLAIKLQGYNFSPEEGKKSLNKTDITNIQVDTLINAENNKFSFKLSNPTQVLLQTANNYLLKTGSFFYQNMKSAKNDDEVIAIDEAHKNSVSTDSGRAIQARREDATIINLTGTPKDDDRNLLWERRIKDDAISFLIHIGSSVPRVKETFQNAILQDLTSSEGLKNYSFLEIFLRDKKFKDPSNPEDLGFYSHIYSFFSDMQEHNLEQNPLKTGGFDNLKLNASLCLGNSFDFILNKIKNKIYNEVLIRKIDSKKISIADLPHIDFADYGFYEKYFGKIDGEKSFPSATVFYANLKLEDKGLVNIDKLSPVKYIIEIDKGENETFDSKRASVLLGFLGTREYFLSARVPLMEKAVVQCCETFFDSFTLRDGENNSELTRLNKIKTRNRKILNDKIKSNGFNIDINGFINDFGSKTNTSASDVAIDLLLNRGYSNISERYKDKEKKDIVNEKVKIIKDICLKDLLNYINSRTKELTPKEIETQIKRTAGLTHLSNPYIVENVEILEPYEYPLSVKKPKKPDLIIDNDLILKDRSGNFLHFNIDMRFDKETILELYPNVGNLFDSNMTPYMEKIVSSHSKALASLQAILNTDFNTKLKNQIEKDYNFPIFTDRIGSVFFSTLGTLDKMMEDQMKKQNQNEKTVVILANRDEIRKPLMALDTKELRNNYNINLVMVKNTENFQSTLDRLKVLDSNPSVIIGNRSSLAEGIQFHGYTRKNDNFILNPDGLTPTNKSALIQSLARVVKLEQKGVFTIPVSFSGLNYKVKTKQKSDLFDSLNIFFNNPSLNSLGMEEMVEMAKILKRHNVVASSLIPKSNIRSRDVLELKEASSKAVPPIDDGFRAKATCTVKATLDDNLIKKGEDILNGINITPTVVTTPNKEEGEKEEVKTKIKL